MSETPLGLVADRLETRTARAVSLPYLAHIPKATGGNDTFPAVIYLHGAGAKGSMDSLRREPIPALAAEGRIPSDFLLLCPLCPADVPGWRLDDLETFVAAMRARYPLDPARLTLTGVSMGGRGAWEYAAWHGDELAALVPVCGFGVPNLAPRYTGLPVWAFHGDADTVLPIARSDEMVTALQKKGETTDVRYTRLAGAGHNIGRAVYDTPDLWDWLADRRRI